MKESAIAIWIIKTNCIRIGRKQKLVLPKTTNWFRLLGINCKSLLKLITVFRKLLLLTVCCLCFTSANAQLIINEVLYDPSNAGLEGDANGDGIYDQVQDEFIEFVNTSSADLDVSRYRIYDHDTITGLKTLRHTMGYDLILPPGGALVVFGGGTAIGTFGGAHVEVDLGTLGLSLGNSGEKIFLADSSGNWIDSINTNALSNNPNESYTRNPDITGAFAQHGSVTPGKLFSPGTYVNGSPFNTQTGISGKIREKSSLIFPNPGNGEFQISAEIEGQSILISDLFGRKILSIEHAGRNISMGNAPEGLYFIYASESKKSQVFVLKH